MHQQLTLWPESQIPEPETEIWQKLDPNTQRTLVTTLARLIHKALCAEILIAEQEVRHEHE
jgi:hypothetical protein